MCATITSGWFLLVQRVLTTLSGPQWTPLNSFLDTLGVQKGGLMVKVKLLLLELTIRLRLVPPRRKRTKRDA